MFQYAIAISEKNKSDKIKIDISTYSDDELRRFELSYYNISGLVCDDKYARNIWNIVYSLKAILYNFNGFCPNWLGYEKEEYIYQKVKGCRVLNGYWQNLDYFDWNREQIIKEFTCKLDFSDKQKIIREQILSKTSTAIHIRRTDYLNPINSGKYCTIPESYYENAMKYIIRNKGPQQFFVFSDDIGWCKKQKIFKDINNVTFIDDNEIDGSTVIDMELMRCCENFIIANSTFSWWASYLSEKKNKTIISPARWLVDESKNEKLKNAILKNCILINN